MKGYPGSGKSTLAHALSHRLGWPLIDKDDIMAALDGLMPKADSAAYAIMWELVERQLSVGLSAICDSPLMTETYESAVALASRTEARLIVIERECHDDAIVRGRIQGRQERIFSSNSITDWAGFQTYRDSHSDHVYDYPISGPRLTVDTRAPISKIITRTRDWLGTVGSRCKSVEI